MQSMIAIFGSPDNLLEKPWKLGALNVALAVAYFFVAVLSLRIALPGSVATPFWPPTGLAIAAVLSFGPRVLPAIFLGAFAANFYSGVFFWVAPVLGLGNMLEALVAYSLLNHVFNFEKGFCSIRSVLSFLFSACLVAPFCSAFIGVTSLSVSGSLVGENPFSSFWTWWLGDALGALIFAPLLIVLFGTLFLSEVSAEKTRILESFFLVFAIFIICTLTFRFNLGGRYLIFPPLVWAALRFGPRGAILGNSLATLVGVGLLVFSYTAEGQSLNDASSSILELQAFLGTCSATILLLAAAVQTIGQSDALLAERARSEALLKDSEIRFRQLAENIQGVFFMTEHPSGNLIYVSPNCGKILGITSESVLSGLTPFAQFVHEQDRDSFKGLFSGSENQPQSMRYRMLRPDGELVWLWTRIFPIFDNSNGCVRRAGITEDVTEYQRVQVELLRSKEAADFANKAKSRFLANMSHEIRTPLGVILGFSEMLQEDKLNSEEKIESILAIRRNGEQLQQIINDILDLSKVEAGKIEISLSRFSLVQFLAELKVSLLLVAQEKGIQFEVSLPDDLPEYIETDQYRLRQILMNIAGNALKFTERGFVRIEVSCDLLEDQGQYEIGFLVVDSGRGMSSDYQKQLFQPFVQEDNSPSRRFGGTGLGLALSRQLAGLLDGEVFLVRSAPGEGTAFRISIRVSDLTGIRRSRFSETEFAESEGYLFHDLSTQKLAGVQVLLVDDSSDNRLLVSRMLEHAGAVVRCAVDGAEGISKAISFSHDVVLMDLQMPKMDGYQATSHLRKIGYSAPIIALTAHAFKEEREKCLRSGFSDHVAKPVNRICLIQTIQNQIDSSKQKEV